MLGKAWLFLLGFVFLVVACQREAPPPPRAVPQKIEKKEVKEVAKEVAKEEEFIYKPAGKPDPFLPFVELAPPPAARPGVSPAVRPGVPPAVARPGAPVAARPGAPPPAVKPKPRPALPATPLQRFDLADLKVVGIIASPEGDRALIEDPQGKGYIVAAGTGIGLKDGVIKNISSKGVLVEEEEAAPTGETVTKEVVMAIGRPVERRR